MKVFISTSTFAEFEKKPLVILHNSGFEYSQNPHKRALSESEISDFLKAGSYVGLIAGTEPLTRKVIDEAVSLRVISRVGAGMDNIDMAAANDRKIKIFNTPDVLTDSVAELTMGLILSVLRKIPYLDRVLRGNNWKKETGNLFKGKTLGIIGFGRIGRRVAALATSFGAEVIFYDTIDFPDAGGSLRVSFDELLKRADIISLHVSDKKTLIGDTEFSRIKNGAVLINTSRGAVIDEKSLYLCLKSGKISAAGLDVFPQEPYSGKLLELDNVVATPHIGSYALEARIEMEIQAVKNLLDGLGASYVD